VTPVTEHKVPKKIQGPKSIARKTLGGGGKRHLKKMKKSQISKAAIRRLCLKSNNLIMNAKMVPIVRQLFDYFTGELTRDTVLFLESRNKKIVHPRDVEAALRRKDTQLFGH
jgi:histone H3/H4